MSYKLKTAAAKESAAVFVNENRSHYAGLEKSAAFIFELIFLG